MSAAELSADVGPRASTSSTRSTGSRRQNNPQQQLHSIERSVTHLLVATKSLLETLTAWSRGTATEGEVSDVYVRLGYEFNIACRSFASIGVDTTDLGPVPDLLRNILEETLSQEASQASLDRYLPRIRDIIINLLQGLKKKQAKLRQRAAKDVDRSGTPSRQDSTDNASFRGEPPERKVSGNARASMQRQGSKDLGNGPDIPPRTSSREDSRESPTRLTERFDSRSTLQSTDSSLSSDAAATIPIITPYPEEDTMPTSMPKPPPHATTTFPPPPPPPPPKQQDALLALQRGGDLERRASRRFSTYQIKQQLGPSASSIPMIPPAQNSPIPNRGREVRESIQAVRQRGSTQFNRQKTERRLAGETSPPRNLSRFSEESAQSSRGQDPLSPSSPMLKTPEDKLGPSYFEKDGSEQPRVSATLAGPMPELSFDDTPQQEDDVVKPSQPPARQLSRKEHTPPVDTSFTVEDSPQPGKPLTLFLQYKSKVKKIILDDGSNDLSIGRLQLAFIDKFAWNSHSEGIDLPEIYIQDAQSGVRFELEDLSDIKNNTVLVLNVEQLDEVKRHVDDGFSTIRRVVETIKTAVEDQQSAIKLISDRQQETVKGLAGLAVAPQVNGIRSPEEFSSRGPVVGTPSNVNSMIEIQSLRRDLAVMRQTYSSFTSDIEASMAAVRTKALAVKSVAVKVALPDLKGETGRAYVNNELYEVLPKDSSTIIESVDEVQDSIEDLRKDVVLRGVRPLPRQLEQMAKDLSHATAEVKRLEDYLKKQTPMWTKIWKHELQQVCDDKESLADAEALVADMKYDLNVVENTFKLVEEACKQQNLEASRNDPEGKQARNVSGGKMAAFAMDQNVDPRIAKDGVLGAVKGLTIDHDSRLDAIQRAEKARKKELEGRKEGAFKKELGSFVDESKLKKTGGVEEAERLRKMKDERSRKENFERAAARATAAKERGRAKAEGATETPPPAANGPEQGGGDGSGTSREGSTGANDVQDGTAMPGAF